MKILLGIALSIACIPPVLAEWLAVADEWTPYNLTQPQKDWFQGAHSKRTSNCCSQADGHPTVWETRKGKYWTEVKGEMLEVPDDAVVEGPSPVGVATVWYRMTYDARVGQIVPNIKCFWPGAEL